MAFRMRRGMVLSIHRTIRVHHSTKYSLQNSEHCAAVCFVRQTNDYLAYAAVTVLGTTGSNVLNILRLRSFVTFSRKYEMNIRRHFKPMFAFSISSITSGMYGQIDMLLLGFSARTMRWVCISWYSRFVTCALVSEDRSLASCCRDSHTTRRRRGMIRRPS